MAAINQSNVFSMVSMPSPEFLRKDRFEPVANGSIYIGKTDSDPTNPANQIPVYAYQEDGSLVQVSQPLKINDAGYPVYNGKATKFITQSAASMRVLDQDGAEMWYWPNLFVYDPAQMWNVLTSHFGAGIVGTEITNGTVQDQLNGYVTPWNFIGKPGYATDHAAIQAMFDYAKANNKLVWCVGYTLNTNGILTADGINVIGGTWNLAGNDPRFTNCEVMGARFEGRSVWLKDSVMRDCWMEKSRVRHNGGDVRVLDTRFNGMVDGRNVCSLVIQADINAGIFPDGTIEVDGCLFTGCRYGILHQGGNAKMHRGTYRNLVFMDTGGDCIQLNVVNDNYEDGCVIENIQIYNCNAYYNNANDYTAPAKSVNWGMGIGVAGKDPYAWDAPDNLYCANFTIRNVTIYGVRQCIHVEVGRNFTIENVHVNPDINKSTDQGLPWSGVYLSGCKDFTVSGVTGEPVGNSTYPATDGNMIEMHWGPVKAPRVIQERPPCRNWTISNVSTKQGGVELTCDAYPGFKWSPSGADLPPYPSRNRADNINCYRFSPWGVSTQLDLVEVHCVEWDGLGDTSSGGGHNNGAADSNGLFIRTKSVLNMYNVTATDANGFGGQRYSKCRYSEINKIGGNVDAPMWVNFYGSLGQLIGNTANIYYTIPDFPGYRRLFARAFPTGREFQEGDLIIARDDSEKDDAQGNPMYVPGENLIFYLVTKAGAWIPDLPDFALAATTVGSTTLTAMNTPGAAGVNAGLLNHNQISPGCRITIPGAGQGGAALNTWITRPPYQTPPSDPSAPITFDIAHPIQTATGAGIRFKATHPIEVYPPKALTDNVNKRP